MGLLKGRSKERPENRVLGSLWSPLRSAFGHLRVKPLSPFLAPRDGSRILHEAQVGGGRKVGAPDPILTQTSRREEHWPVVWGLEAWPGLVSEVGQLWPLSPGAPSSSQVFQGRGFCVRDEGSTLESLLEQDNVIWPPTCRLTESGGASKPLATTLGVGVT